MSDKLDDAQSHNTDNETQKTEDNIKENADSLADSNDDGKDVMRNIVKVSKVYRDYLKEVEKLKLSTLEAPVFYSYYELWSEESNKLFKRSVILKRRYNKIRNSEEQAG